ncbi:MAG: hypothetical protein B5766_05930 [Candidatus Lumbricidophila eiseniae]|uniref:Probable acetyl-CoA acetyltransferase n=1 Tax=Candidatus Lumbricidiphila eiseniae TaxID=1969409 RepID=A0A2A6FS14_9MICO|nr:MAG: hypothetical protein B5766_05930 [Candidatus Lumbricidophila eiseniae]
MTTADAPVLLTPFRTAVGSIGRGFATHTVDALAAPVLAAVAQAVAGAGIPIDDLLLGNCLGPGGNIARVSALRAGLGLNVPAVTVDRQCGSGLDAVLQAVARVAAGHAQLVLAGGAESASTAPWRYWPPEPGTDVPRHRYERAPFAPVGMSDPEMGPAADALAAHYSISRERQDAWAARSHHRATRTQASGGFVAEIVPVGVPGTLGTAGTLGTPGTPETAGTLGTPGVNTTIATDDRPRAALTITTLARFPAAFTPGGTVTAGNSCGISDGAAALAVTTETVRQRLGVPGLRVIATAVTAGDSALPGIGAATAIQGVCQRAGVVPGEIAHVEITEAFAAQVLAVTDVVGIDEDTVSSQGGAIALGHPWGASGAILLVRLAARMGTLSPLSGSDTATYPGSTTHPTTPHPDNTAHTQPSERSGLKQYRSRTLGLAACSIGGGQGIAILVERVG